MENSVLRNWQRSHFGDRCLMEMTVELRAEIVRLQEKADVAEEVAKEFRDNFAREHVEMPKIPLPWEREDG